MRRLANAWKSIGSIVSACLATKVFGLFVKAEDLTTMIQSILFLKASNVTTNFSRWCFDVFFYMTTAIYKLGCQNRPSPLTYQISSNNSNFVSFVNKKN